MDTGIFPCVFGEDVTTRRGLGKYIMNLCEAKTGKNGFMIPYIGGGISMDETITAFFRGEPKKNGDPMHIILKFIEYLRTIIYKHPNYILLAGRITTDILVRTTHTTFSEYVEYTHGKGLLSDTLAAFVKDHSEMCNALVDTVKNYRFKLMGAKVLINGILRSINDGEVIKILETPEYLWIRLTLSVVKDPANNWDKVEKLYNLLSAGHIVMPTPMLVYSGTERQTTASCFLLSMKDDVFGFGGGVAKIISLLGMGGGIGVNLGEFGEMGNNMGGVQSAMDLLNKVPKITGTRARSGAIATWLPIYHVGVVNWLASRTALVEGDVAKAHNLFMGLMFSDHFMECVENDADWYLFCPKKAPGLQEVSGVEQRALYLKYVAEGKYSTVLKARVLFTRVCNTINTTGIPYVVHGDTVNRMNNLKHLGVIKNSNLCAEVMQHSTDNDVAVCNLSTICVKNFVDQKTKKFDYGKLVDAAKAVSESLNQIIDMSEYKLDEFTFYRRDQDGKLDEKENIISYANKRNRPMGVGIQSFHDALYEMNIPFRSELVPGIMAKMYEGILYGLMRKSCDLARENGAPHESFAGSELSKGRFHFDNFPGFNCERDLSHDLFDWKTLRHDVAKWGVMNGLFVAQPPTATSAQINGNVESIEPITSNRYTWRVSHGRYTMLNKYMVEDFEKVGIWDEEMMQEIEVNNGSVRTIARVPEVLMRKYVIAREVDHKYVVRMLSKASPFIDQGISLNHHMLTKDLREARGVTDVDLIARSLKKTWKSGIKTGQYYVRGEAPAKSASFGKLNINKPQTCSLVTGDCESCTA